MTRPPSTNSTHLRSDLRAVHRDEPELAVPQHVGPHARQDERQDDQGAENDQRGDQGPAPAAAPTTGREPRTGSDSKLTGGELTHRTAVPADRCQDRRGRRRATRRDGTTAEDSAGDATTAAGRPASPCASWSSTWPRAGGTARCGCSPWSAPRAPWSATRSWPPGCPRTSSRAAQADPEHLTLVEQEGLPDAASLEELLGGVAWPDTVDGAALVTERVVVPPEVEAQVPDDPGEALTWLANHPARREVRLAAAVMRDGDERLRGAGPRPRPGRRRRRRARPRARACVEGLAATLR